MRITQTMDYAASPEAVFAMMTSEEFQEQKCADAGALSHHVAASLTGGHARIVVGRDLPTDRLPDFAKSLVGQTLSTTETWEWDDASSGGERRGTLTVEVKGTPIAMRSTFVLAGNGAGSVVTIDGELKASIPLFGGKIEKASAPAVLGALRSEQRTGSHTCSSQPAPQSKPDLQSYFVTTPKYRLNC